MKLIGSLMAMFLAGNAMAAAIDVRYTGACAGADFDAQGTDIEYINLNLDLFEGVGAESKECVITTTIPARRGFAIDVTQFVAEGAAEIDGTGLASMSVNHRFNGQDLPIQRQILRSSGSFSVKQKALGVSVCSKEVVLRTKLAVKANNAIVLQDKAQSNTVRAAFLYIPCP